MTNKTSAELLAELREKLELAKEPGGEKAVAKRDKKGIPSARARIHALRRPGQLPGDRCAVQDAGRSRCAVRRRRGHRPRHHQRPPGRRVQPRPDGVPGLGRRDVRPQGRQADGVGGDGRLPDHRHQRLRRRPHPGRGHLAGVVRRAGPPPRTVARPGAGGVHHPRQMRWRSGVFADPDRPGGRGARSGLHVRHRARCDQGRHRRGCHPRRTRWRRRAGPLRQHPSGRRGREGGVPVRPRLSELPARQHLRRRADRQPGPGARDHPARSRTGFDRAGQRTTWPTTCTRSCCGSSTTATSSTSHSSRARP